MLTMLSVELVDPSNNLMNLYNLTDLTKKKLTRQLIDTSSPDKDPWRCPECNLKKVSYSQISYYNLQTLLVVNVKRFIYQMNVRKQLHKVLLKNNFEFDIYLTLTAHNNY